MAILWLDTTLEWIHAGLVMKLGASIAFLSFRSPHLAPASTYPISVFLFSVFHKTASHRPDDWYFTSESWCGMNTSCKEHFRFRMCRPISGCRRIAMRISLESFTKIRNRFNACPIFPKHNQTIYPRTVSVVDPGLYTVSSQLDLFPFRALLFIPPRCSS